MVGDQVARALDEDVRPVALLVHDTSWQPVVVRPRRRWAPLEALNTAERRVLNRRRGKPVHGTVPDEPSVPG